LSVPLVCEIANLCGSDPGDPPTSRTDDVRSQYRALHYSASRGKKNSSVSAFFGQPYTVDRPQYSAEYYFKIYMC